MGVPAKSTGAESPEFDPAGEDSALGNPAPFEALPGGVMVFDRLGEVLFGSAQCTGILGGEVKNLDANGSSGEPPRGEILSALRQARDAWKPTERLVSFDGKHRHYFYVATRPGGDASKDRMSALVIDLTDLVMGGNIASEFIRQIRHDLRGPLTSIRGGIEMLMSERLGKLEERQMKLLRIMEKGTRIMTAMLSGMGTGSGSAPGGVAPNEEGEGRCPEKS